MGKGDKDRVQDRKAFRNNYDKVFKRKRRCQKCNGTGRILKLEADAITSYPCTECAQ